MTDTGRQIQVDGDGSSFKNSREEGFELSVREVPPHRLLRHFMGEIDCRLLPLHVDFVSTFADIRGLMSIYVNFCRFMPVTSQRGQHESILVEVGR